MHTDVVKFVSKPKNIFTTKFLMPIRMLKLLKNLCNVYGLKCLQLEHIPGRFITC